MYFYGGWRKQVTLALFVHFSQYKPGKLCYNNHAEPRKARQSAVWVPQTGAVQGKGGVEKRPFRVARPSARDCPAGPGGRKTARRREHRRKG